MWHNLTRQARDDGKLVVLGVIQEQHPDRCRLFSQWQGMDWPILHDPINLVENRAVPIFVAIDESGVVVDANLRTTEYEAFLNRPISSVDPPNLDLPFQITAKPGDRGDFQALQQSSLAAEQAISEYKQLISANPNQAALYFRLGVAQMMRFDHRSRDLSDFQLAIDSWSRALELDPNHYIYRRRIQQYGPRLTKPYPFYDWVRQARDEITRRGDKPVELVTEPVGAEIAHPIRSISSQNDVEPDPNGRINRDREQFINASTVLVPSQVSPGDPVRVHVRMQPSKDVHWNNESDKVTIWINVPDGWKADRQRIELPQPLGPESDEVRRFDFELQTLGNASNTKVTGYALYYVCEEKGGQCLYLRKDFSIPISFK